MLWLLAKPRKVDGGLLHHAEEVDDAREVVGGHRLHRLELLGEGLLVEADDIGHRRELRFRLLGGLGVEGELAGEMLSRNQMSEVARWVASSQAVRDLASGL